MNRVVVREFQFRPEALPAPLDERLQIIVIEWAASEIRSLDGDRRRAGAAQRGVHTFCSRLPHPVELRSGVLDACHDVFGVFRVIADSPVRNGNLHRTSGGHEIENQAQLVVLQCGDGVIARRDLRRGSDGVRVFADQLRDRHREVTDQRRMNEIPEVDDTCYAVFVDEGVQATDVVVDDLRALHL